MSKTIKTNDNCVYSPVNGFIDKILSTTHNRYYKIYLYITRQSDHRLFLPVNGTMYAPITKNGLIIEDPIHQNPNQLFKQLDTRHTT